MKFKLLTFLVALSLLADYTVSQTPTPSMADRGIAGSQVYLGSCAACHMPDGTGVPGMQPALDGDPVVAGDPTQLIRVVLLGPNKALPENRPVFSNTMPPFSQLSDQQIADVLTYIRQQYGDNASEIEPSQVAALRP
jgi:mono/diheme cytochrome c family protein